jgi:hypothetical protein
MVVALNGSHNGRELQQQAVAHGLDDPAARTRHQWASRLTVLPNCPRGPGLVLAQPCFVGPNWELYRPVAESLQNGKPALSWSWSAFLFTELWLAYRRRFSWTALFIGFTIVAGDFLINVWYILN